LDTLYEICDRVAVIADRRVIAVGTIAELVALDHPWIQEYFNGPRGRAAKAGAHKVIAGRAGPHKPGMDKASRAGA
ncbi:MAG TPA: ABC transporter ATP-binding protein, partial [Novosphingobium sp.]|nr:ABC transporter ATP-binding protein [Novosphingobium sp.]